MMEMVYGASFMRTIPIFTGYTLLASWVFQHLPMTGCKAAFILSAIYMRPNIVGLRDVEIITSQQLKI